jgi:hypothetical protein
MTDRDDNNRVGCFVYDDTPVANSQSRSGAALKPLDVALSAFGETSDAQINSAANVAG